MTDTNLDDFFGDPASTKGTSEHTWVNHNIEKDVPFLCRIAPPVKKQKNNRNGWYFYDKLHFGYSTKNPNNPDKNRIRPFRCIEDKDFKTKIIKQDCPECTYILSKRDEAKKIESQKIASGMSKEEVSNYMRAFNEFFKKHNLNKRYYVFAKDVSGRWGILKLPYSAWEAISNFNKSFKEKFNSSILGRKGVWLEILRTGDGLKTNYRVELVMENLSDGTMRYKTDELTAADAASIEGYPDLSDVNSRNQLSYDQIAALVNSGGEPTVVEMVFNQHSRVESSDTENDTELEESPMPSSMTPTSPPTSVKQDDLAAQIAALQAQMAAREQVTSANTTTPTTPAKVAPAATQKAAVDLGNISSLDPQKFLEMFPDPNKK